MSEEEASKQQEKRGDDGRFLPGGSGNPSGRPEGSKNKFTNLKDVFLEVFENIGGADELERWVGESKYNKRLFYQWLTRMLPTSISGDVKGDITLTVKKVVTDERPDE